MKTANKFSEYRANPFNTSAAWQPLSEVVGGLSDPLQSHHLFRSSSLATLTTPSGMNGTLDSTDLKNPTRAGRLCDDYLLTGVSAGQVVQLNLSASAFDTYLQVVNAATGQIITFNDDANLSLNSQVNFTVQDGINYIVRATSYASDATGAYSLTTNLGALTSATPVNLNQNVNGTLANTDSISPTTPVRPGSYYDGYLLTNLTPGQQVQVSLESSTFDPYLEVVTTTGNLVTYNDNFNGQNSLVSFTAQAGTNYIVRATGAATAATGAYRLVTTVVAASDGAEPGNTLSTAEVETSPIFSRSQQVSTNDSNDFYRFSVSQSGIFTANLTGLTGDADVRLIQDTNNNGVIDQGEVQAWQWERGTGNESIRRFLNAGTYFLQVMSYHNQTANYNVATNFTAAASDDRRFSIQVNFGLGTESLNDTLRNAVREAARTWENIISYSTFDRSYTLTIDITGEDLGSSTLAGATWDSGRFDLNGRFIPTTGMAIINTSSELLAVLTSNASFFQDVMTHEFGHVLGIGSLWGTEQSSSGTTLGRNFVNRSAGTYSVNTYAGWYYGELLDTYAQTALPVTTGEGEGSDYSHWREQIFDSELMTHQAESTTTNMPLSQLTIAALRDLGYNVNYGAAEPYSLTSTTGSGTSA
ncbi:MAG TPA: pre-peptidase C-terminal domain-containing protein [Waterburya sp.]